MDDILEKIKDRFNRKVCLHCETPVEKHHQVGRCVYAEPCNCRQYQGKIPEEQPEGDRHER